MSANNCFVLKEHNGQWYGWDTMAEESFVDAEETNHERVLHYSEAKATANSQKACLYFLSHTEPLPDSNDLEISMASPLNYSEYGVVLDDHLPKDGTPIRYED